MHYLDEGEGPPVVMLHGNPTWSFYYRELVKGLRDTHRVIVPDHVGCGMSDRPAPYAYTLATHIGNVTRLIEHLGLRDISLVVHDWGGAIGFGWAVDHPQLVKRLVVFNTAAFFGPTPWRIRVCRWPVFGEIALLGLNAFARAAIHVACVHRERMTSAVRAGYLLPYSTWSDRRGILAFVRDIPVSPRVPSHAIVRRMSEKLRMLRDKPMLIAWGLRDFCFHEGFLNEWTNRFPDAEVHRFEDAGHYVVEDTHERILPLLQPFLAK